VARPADRKDEEACRGRAFVRCTRLVSLEETRRKIEEHLSRETGAEVKVADVALLSGGACQENYRVDVRAETGELAPSARLVLRSDAARSLPGSIDRTQEFAVIRKALEAGVKTPRVRWLASDLLQPGRSAYFLDFHRGEAIGRRVVGRPELARAREALPAQLAAELAKIHSIKPVPGLFTTGENPDGTRDPAATTLEQLRRTMDAMVEPHPAMEYVHRWLSARMPAVPEVVLAHGDFRTGNFLVDESGLVAILDWEFARWGAPAQDIAYFCMRDWRFGALDKAAGGIARRELFYEAYEKASGRALDPDEVRWWEILSNLQWAAGSVHQAERFLSGAERDFELVAIGRRANEMEWEALRLIGEVS
jgi:aminoglycoside phosphotransferase (APT) family kinase protein